MLLSNHSSRILFNWCFILLCISSGSHFYRFGLYSLFPMLLTVGISVVLLIYFYKSKHLGEHKLQDFDKILLYVYFIYMTIMIIYGVFEASNYYEYKALIINSLSLMLPLCIYFFVNVKYTSYTLKLWLKYGLRLLFIPIIILSHRDGWGFYLSPLLFLGFFFPIFSKKWKFIILSLIIIGAFTNLGGRSNIIKYSVMLILIISYYWKMKSTFLYRLGRLFFFIIPFIFVYLGFIGKFNIFEMDKYIQQFEVTNSYGHKEELTDDTRSAIYIDVYKTLNSNNKIIYGMSPARGYETKYAESILKAIYKAQNFHGATNLKAERSKSEVGAVNILLWTGIIGVIITSLIIWRATFFGISKSNNIYIRTLGLYTAFRYCYWWVEDGNTFTTMTLFYWLAIAVCLSSEFRSMNNKEIAEWIRSILK